MTYLGAFAPAVPTWLGGWTALDQMGYLSGSAVPAEEGPAATAFALAVGPNPTRADATVRFTLARAQRVRLAVFDALGRRVAVLAEGPFAAGPATVAVPTATLPTGVYIVRLDGEDGAAARQISVVR